MSLVFYPLHRSPPLQHFRPYMAVIHSIHGFTPVVVLHCSLLILGPAIRHLTHPLGLCLPNLPRGHLVILGSVPHVRRHSRRDDPLHNWLLTRNPSGLGDEPVKPLHMHILWHISSGVGNNPSKHHCPTPLCRNKVLTASVCLYHRCRHLFFYETRYAPAKNLSVLFNKHAVLIE